ncbi:MAG TPA: hypothetical protein VJ260_09930 [Vicinamibacterales bacterium]|nr:hypothetical protein [Vicinamibacterales bacterium]
MYASSDAAEGSMREAGIRLPGKGCPVSGSMIGVLSDEKSPVRAADVGTVEKMSSGESEWLPL